MLDFLNPNQLAIVPEHNSKLSQQKKKRKLDLKPLCNINKYKVSTYNGFAEIYIACVIVFTVRDIRTQWGISNVASGCDGLLIKVGAKGTNDYHGIIILDNMNKYNQQTDKSWDCDFNRAMMKWGLIWTHWCKHVTVLQSLPALLSSAYGVTVTIILYQGAAQLEDGRLACPPAFLHNVHPD